MNLETIVKFYSRFFLNVRYSPAGTYTVHDETAVFAKPWVNIHRPGNDTDWSLVIEERGDHYLARLCECWAGTELCQFSFCQIDALVDLFPIFQRQIERMTNPLIGTVELPNE
jgi:hypothetical protein